MDVFIKRKYLEFLKLEPLEFKASYFEPVNLKSAGAYIDSYIVEYINNLGWKYKVFEFDFQGISIKLKISEGKNIKKIVYYFCFLIYLFSQVRSINELEVSIIRCKLKKLMPLDGSEMTPLHVNSGLTYGTHVLVYRNEEMIKVLTHELIHAFGIDRKTISAIQEKEITDLFGIQCKSVFINEAFTDTLACYINAVMYAVIRNERVSSALAKEKRHIVRVAEEILWRRLGKNLCEKTHVTAYYVIKAMLFKRLPAFIGLLQKHHMCFDFEIREFIELIKGCDQLVPRSHGLRNLRMSCLEILKGI